jgi:hypothetical protein
MICWLVGLQGKYLIHVVPNSALDSVLTSGFLHRAEKVRARKAAASASPSTITNSKKDS